MYQGVVYVTGGKLTINTCEFSIINLSVAPVWDFKMDGSVLPSQRNKSVTSLVCY